LLAAPHLGVAAPEARPRAPLHAHLLSSEPAAGETVRSRLERVTLTFSEPLEAAFNRIELVGSDGARISLAPARDPRDARRLVAEAPDLPEGAYRLAWRVVSADGHKLSGELAFTVAAAPQEAQGASSEAAAWAAAAETPVSETGRTTASGIDAGSRRPAQPDAAVQGAPSGTPGVPELAGSASADETASSTAAALARGAALTALIALAGLLAMLAWFTSGPPDRPARLVAPLALVASLLLVGDSVLWLRTVSEAPLDWGSLGAALRTRIGAIGAVRVALALLTLVFWSSGRGAARAAVAALLAVALTGAMGHPSAIDPALSMPANAIHLLAVSLWMGGLLVLVLGRRSDSRFRDDALRVSRVALAAVVVIALTGTLQVLLFLPSPRDLVASTYGLLVLGKLAGLGVLVAFGARNRFRLLPPLTAGGPPSALRRAVSAETLVMTAVILLAAFLGYVAPPTSSEPRATASRPAHETRAAIGSVPTSHASVEALP
jgi:copper transport protein